MNVMKKMLIVLAAALMLGFVTTASATCSVGGKITRVYSVNIGTADYAYYYLNPSHTGLPSAVVYFFYVNGDRTSDALAAAASDFRNVHIVGSAAACPTTGTYRYGGLAYYSYVFPAL